MFILFFFHSHSLSFFLSFRRPRLALHFLRKKRRPARSGISRAPAGRPKSINPPAEPNKTKPNLQKVFCVWSIWAFLFANRDHRFKAAAAPRTNRHKPNAQSSLHFDDHTPTPIWTTTTTTTRRKKNCEKTLKKPTRSVGKKQAPDRLDNVANYSQLLRCFGELSADLVDLGLCIMLGQRRQQQQDNFLVAAGPGNYFHPNELAASSQQLTAPTQRQPAAAVAPAPAPQTTTTGSPALQETTKKVSIIFSIWVRRHCCWCCHEKRMASVWPARGSHDAD